MYVYIHSETAEKMTGAGVKDKTDPEKIEKAEKAYDGLVLEGKDAMKTLQYKK
jgi:hypothetical protein